MIECYGVPCIMLNLLNTKYVMITLLDKLFEYIYLLLNMSTRVTK